jgi:hypothetical protein
MSCGSLCPIAANPSGALLPSGLWRHAKLWRPRSIVRIARPKVATAAQHEHVVCLEPEVGWPWPACDLARKTVAISHEEPIRSYQPVRHPGPAQAVQLPRDEPYLGLIEHETRCIGCVLFARIRDPVALEPILAELPRTGPGDGVADPGKHSAILRPARRHSTMNEVRDEHAWLGRRSVAAGCSHARPTRISFPVEYRRGMTSSRPARPQPTTSGAGAPRAR